MLTSEVVCRVLVGYDDLWQCNSLFRYAFGCLALVLALPVSQWQPTEHSTAAVQSDDDCTADPCISFT